MPSTPPKRKTAAPPLASRPLRAPRSGPAAARPPSSASARAPAPPAPPRGETPAERSDKDAWMAPMAGGVLSKFLSLGLTKFSSLIGQVIIFHFLSPSQAGLFFIASAFSSLLSSIMGLGLPHAAIRFVPLLSAQGKREELERLVWTLAAATLGISLLMAVILGLFAQPISDAYGKPLAPLMGWIIALSVFSLIGAIFTSFLDGVKRFELTAAIQAAQQMARVALMPVAFLLFGADEHSALGALLVTTVLATLYLAYRSWPSLGRFERRKLDAGKLTESLRFGLPVYISTMVDVLASNIDVLLLGFFMPLETVAIYSAIIVIVRNIAPFVFGPIASVQQPLLSEQQVHSPQGFGRMVRDVSKWTMYAGIPFCLMVGLYGSALLHLIAPKYASYAPLIWYFVPMAFMVLLSNSSRNALFAKGKTLALLSVSLLIVALNFALNWELIPLWGMVGSAIATSTALCVGEFVAILWARRETGAALHPHILHALAAGALLLLLNLVPLPVPGGSLSGWALGGFLSASIAQPLSFALALLPLLAAGLLSLGAYGAALFLLGGFGSDEGELAVHLIQRLEALRRRFLPSWGAGRGRG